MKQTATLKNITRLAQTDKAWQLDINGKAQWVPFSVIDSFNPGQKTCAIQIWWLIANNIEFRV